MTSTFSIIDFTEPVVFNIMVHKGTGLFEIMESSQVVAAGRVYVPVNIRNERIQIPATAEENSIILDRLDFYRHVLINGYNFKGMFRSIAQINSEGKNNSNRGFLQKFLKTFPNFFSNFLEILKILQKYSHTWNISKN